MKKKKSNNCIRCAFCGKFISYAELEKGEIKSTFTPDTMFTVEETEFAHIKCIEKHE